MSEDEELAAFDEEWYRQAYPDVANLLASGHLKSGLEHFAKYGRYEGRLGHSGAERVPIVHEGTTAELPLPSLICVGLEKCGTTSLDAALRTSPHVACPKLLKEVQFFTANYARGSAWYRSLYEVRDRTRYMVDVTPSYIRSETALTRIQGSTQPGTKILVCLRNPVYRALSHYLHDIFHHHSVFDPAIYGTDSGRFKRPYAHSFFDAAEQSNRGHFTVYARMVGDVIARFGADNVLVLILERDFASLSDLSRKLGTFLGIEAFSVSLEKRENEMRLPTLLYSDQATKVSTARGLALVPAGSLATLRGREVFQYGPLDSQVGTNILKAASRWTRSLSAMDAEQVFRDVFEKDVTALEGLLKSTIPEWRRFHNVGM